MSVASQIQRIKNAIVSAYSAVSGKGGTLPATQNVENLANAIESIPSGGGGNGSIVSYEGNPVNLYVDYESIGIIDSEDYVDEFVYPVNFKYASLMFDLRSSNARFLTINLDNIVNVSEYPSFMLVGSQIDISCIDYELLNRIYYYTQPYTSYQYNIDTSFLTGAVIVDDSGNDYSLIRFEEVPDCFNLTDGMSSENGTNPIVLDFDYGGYFYGDWTGRFYDNDYNNFYSFVALINIRDGSIGFEYANSNGPFESDDCMFNPVFQLSDQNTIADVQGWFSSYGTGESCNLARHAFITADNGTSVGKTAPAAGFTLSLAYNWNNFLRSYYIGISAYNAYSPDFLANVAPEFRFVCDQNGDVLHYYKEEDWITYIDHQGINSIDYDEERMVLILRWDGDTYDIDTWTEANDYTLSFGNGTYTFTAWAKRRYNPSSNN